MPRLRTLLVLGRISNLPTIWSNCLAAWWLGGGGNPGGVPMLFVGATFLYVGGMFLNDAFDADFDRQHRSKRPIPSGHIPARVVWILGLLWLAIGTVCFFVIETSTGMIGLVLVACILVYDAIHKLITFSPLLMGLCRLVLYIAAASTGAKGVTGWSIWCGLALMWFIVGLSFLARRESARGPLQYWPFLFLLMPVFLAWTMNAGEYRQPALLLSAVLIVWILRSLRPLFWWTVPQVGRAVSNLLAGIVIVDWLAVPDMPGPLSFAFPALFALALLLQRFVPAT